MKLESRWAVAKLIMVVMSILLSLSGPSGAITPLARASAAPPTVADNVEFWVLACGGEGGVAVILFELDSNGYPVGAVVKCFGGARDGIWCFIAEGAVNCMLISTPESVATGPSDTADPGENPRSETTLLEENAAPIRVAAQDPTGGEEVTSIVMATPDEQVLACESLGGIATVITNGSIAATEVHCRGGVLDGSTCIVGHYDTYCTFFRVTTDVTFTDGRAPGSMADVLQNVDGSGKVVVMNQSGDNVENVKNQVAACRALGGVSDPNYDFDPDGTAGFSEATCKGGLLNGLFCFNTPSETVCIFMRAALPDSVQVEPSGGNQVPAENVPVAPSPTIVPTGTVELNPTPTPEPTSMPTSEPTVAPTEQADPPTFPTPATDDVVVPPGEAEDPVVEPTPTEVVLT